MKSFKTLFLNIHLPLIQLITMLVIFFYLSSCGCNGNGKTNGQNGSVVIEVPTTPLVGSATDISVNFRLTELDKIANLEDFILEVALQETDGTGSQIKYQDSAGTLQEVTQGSKSLASYTTLDVLNSSQPDCQISFKLFPGSTVTKLAVNFKLLTQTGDIVSAGTANWSLGDVKLSLTRTSTEHIEGRQKTITLEIENNGNLVPVPNELKLKIVRQKGSTANIQGSSQVGLTNVYLVQLPSIPANSKLPYVLTIDSQADKEAEFSIQLQYLDKEIGNSVKTSWEEGVKLEFGKIEYDRATGKVYADIKNQGTKNATDVTLHYHATTVGATLENVATQEIKIGGLKRDEEHKAYELGTLNFGPTNNVALFQFTLSCTEGNLPIVVSTTKNFIKSDIELVLNSSYDTSGEEVRYAIQNTGKDIAKNLQIVFENVSVDAEGKLAELKLMDPTMSLVIDDLPAGGLKAYAFRLNFKEAEAATFSCKVLYDNHTIVETIDTFQPKPIKLSLKVISFSEIKSSEYMLYGSNNKIKINIEQQKDSRNVDPAYVKVGIQPISGGTISKKLGGSAITEFLVGNLDIDDTIKFHINPAPGAKEARFRFYLTYKDKEIGEPVVINWQIPSLFLIKESHLLIGDQIGKFRLGSQAPIDLDNLSVEVQEDNGLTFSFFKLDKSWVGGPSKLAEITEHKPMSQREETRYIEFKATGSTNIEAAKPIIVIKWGDVVLVREEVDWAKDRTLLVIKSPSENLRILDNYKGKIVIQNTDSKIIDLSKVRIKLTHSIDSPISLNGISTALIDKTLTEITKEAQLVAGAEIDIDLQLNTLRKGKLLSAIKVELIDAKNQTLDKRSFVCFSKKLDDYMSQDNSVLDNIKDIPKLLEPVKDSLDGITQLFATLESILIFAKNLIEDYNQVIQTHPELRPIMGRLPEVNPIFNIPAIEKAIKATQASMLACAQKQQNKIQRWVEEVQVQNEEVENLIQKGIDEVNNLSKLEDLQSENAIGWDKFKVENFLEGVDNMAVNTNIPLDKHSVQGLISLYKYNLKACKDLLLNLGITNFTPEAGDSESIKDLKQVYNQMSDELPTTIQKVQTAFFEAFNRLTQQIAKSIEKKDIDIAYNFLDKQLDKLNDLKSSKDDVMDQDEQAVKGGLTLDKFVVDSCRDIIQNLIELVKVETNKEDVIHDLILVFRAVNAACDIVKETRTEDINKVAKATLLSAIQACQEAINIHGELDMSNNLLSDNGLVTIQDEINYFTNILSDLNKDQL